MQFLSSPPHDFASWRIYSLTGLGFLPSFSSAEFRTDKTPTPSYQWIMHTAAHLIQSFKSSCQWMIRLTKHLKIPLTFTLWSNNPISNLTVPFPIVRKTTNAIPQWFSVWAGLRRLVSLRGGRPAARRGGRIWIVFYFLCSQQNGSGPDPEKSEARKKVRNPIPRIPRVISPQVVNRD